MLYRGIAMPTEAAGVGALLAAVLFGYMLSSVHATQSPASWIGEPDIDRRMLMFWGDILLLCLFPGVAIFPPDNPMKDHN